jgi:DNA-binding PadR family transcriptional regulator
LAERESLAVEQIGAHLGADLDQVRAALHAMRERGLVEALALTPFTGDRRNAVAYWSLTEAGRAELERPRADS